MTDLAVGFHFIAHFSISSETIDSRFQSISGLSVEYDFESVVEGGENRFIHELPLRTKYTPLTMKRAFATSSKLIDWCRDAFENRIFQPANIDIILLNEAHEPLKTWSVDWAIPKKWSVSDFHAEENSLVIETLELHYRTFRIK